MKEWTKPELTLPLPLKGNETGTFAGNTVRKRMPAIGRKMMADAFFDGPTEERLREVFDGMPEGKIEMIDDPFAPDHKAWERYTEPFVGQSWLDVPWFFAETYFYRRILAETGYYHGGENYHVDPYSTQKLNGMLDAMPVFDELVKVFDQGLSRAQVLRTLLVLNLWGNKADLSIFPASGGNEQVELNAEEMEAKIVVNHLNALMKFFKAGKKKRIDIVLDNVGVELVADLVLAFWLVKADFAEQVVLHHKIHPTFVSDATVRDTRETTYQLGKKDEVANAFVLELFDFVEAERIVLMDHEYWTSCLPMWEMPSEVKDYFLESDLIITKGDANYRRLLGDLHWEYDADVRQVMNYSPVPVLAIRINKSEVAIGLKPGQADALGSIDENWLTNGQWGMLMFYDPNEK